MIEAVRLENFKAYRSQEFKLAPLSMLSGINSMGKSSFIQSLLMMRESFLKVSNKEEVGLVNLNADLFQLGSASDALYCDAETDCFTISISTDDGNIEANVDCHENKLSVLPVKTDVVGDVFSSALFSADCFHYLSAERFGPKLTLPNPPPDNCGLGKNGENLGCFLLRHENDEVIESLRHPAAVSVGLKYQLEAWLGLISPGIRLEVRSHPDISQTSLHFEFEGEELTSGPFKAVNVGFGISHVLPVLTAILSSRPGNLIIIDSPESHVHPRGQSMLGQLMAIGASAGVQIVVETHSDHILNGMRIAVKQGKISADDCSFIFFDRIDGIPIVDAIAVDSNGRFDHWPSGFFDEWDNSLQQLL